MFRIVIVSPDELLTLRLTGSLSGVDGLSVVGTAPDAARALEMVRLTEPHVVFVDISLQPVGDLGLIDNIKAARPGTRVVVVAAEGREVTAHRALTAGADGLLAPTGPDDRSPHACTGSSRKRTRTPASWRTWCRASPTEAERDEHTARGDCGAGSGKRG